MADDLSQSEIDFLLSGIAAPADSEGEAKPSPDDRQGVYSSLADGVPINPSLVVLPLSRRRIAALTDRTGSMAYEVYDFRRSDKLSKEHLRTLQVIHESFARVFMSSISGYLRSTVQVELISIEQVPYEEYLRSISTSLINVLNVSPLSGQTILEFDMRILFAMIERLLGGGGESHYRQGKDLTDVEMVLASSVVKRALIDLRNAWQDFVPLEFSVASVETSTQLVQIVPSKETVVLVLFDVQMGEHKGVMSIAIPYMLLKPISSRLHTHRWFSNTGKVGKSLAPRMATRLREQTKVPCIARLGTSTATLEVISSLQIDQILPLNIVNGNRAEGDNSGLARVDILIGQRPKFRGHIGLRGGKRLAVQIDEVVPAPPTLEIHKETAA